MKTKLFFDKLKNRLTIKHTLIILVALLAFISAVSVYQFKRAGNYRDLLQNQYNRSFSELVQYVNNIETSLAKGAVVTNPASLVKIANQISTRSAFATANLGQLPISHEELQNTSKFLSQVGDFTQSLSLKYIDGGEISDKEHQTLAKLSNYANTLNTSLLSIQQELFSNTMSFEKTEGVFSNGQKVMADEISNIEDQFQDYPSLIYDGPFSEHVEKTEPKLIKDAPEITKEQAQERCMEIIGKERSGSVTYAGEDNGKVPGYVFSVLPDNKNKDRTITVEVTKQGGALAWMLDNRFVPESKIDISKAIQKANACLASLGINSMQENYYEIKNNIATINFACVENDVTIYPDLIKIKVAMDSGEILGVESHGYVSNHHNRTFSRNIISEEEARSKLSSIVTSSEKGKLCIIPTDFETEILCYEFKATMADKNFLIYINAETGKEEDVLMLLISEEGTLTI